MFQKKNILAVVPARSGSKGIPDKNMRTIGKLSLIGWAGKCLAKLPWIDVKIISTDSIKYANEGKRYGLLAPFLRPAGLSRDSSAAVDTVIHALRECEKYYKKVFDIILIIEPTSPLRLPGDIKKAVKILIDSGSDSVVTVSALTAKFHPAKVFEINGHRINFYEKRGSAVVSRQSLNTLYWRNGVCYALTRECILKKKKIITKNTAYLIIDRSVVNIDDPIELEWAEFLIAQKK